jgi:hypothetical protein
MDHETTHTCSQDCGLELTEDKLGWIADPDDLHDEEPTTSACVDEWTIALTFDDGPTPGEHGDGVS